MGGITAGFSQFQCSQPCCTAPNRPAERNDDVTLSIRESISYDLPLQPSSTGSNSKVGFFSDDAQKEEREKDGESLRGDARKVSPTRHESYALVNTSQDFSGSRERTCTTESTISTNLGMDLVNRSDILSGDKMTAEELQKTKKELLDQVELLTDQVYDILAAEQLLVQIEKLISPERFRDEVMTTELFERLARKLDYFYYVGVACSLNRSDWMEVYRGDGGRQLITGMLDPNDSTVLQYSVRVEFPTSITNVLAVANETKLLPTWNTLVTKEPVVIGRRTAHYFVINYQISAVGGMYRGDVLNEIRRFTDVDSGIMVEYVTSVDKDHPSYHAPAKGFKRMETVLKNVFLACGPKHTVLIQMGKLKLPFAVNAWIAKLLGGVAGKFVVGSLVKNSLQADVPGNPWQSLIEQDQFGLYHRLGLLANSQESRARDPAQYKDGKVPPFELQGFFEKRRFVEEAERQSPKSHTKGM